MPDAQVIAALRRKCNQALDVGGVLFDDVVDLAIEAPGVAVLGEDRLVGLIGNNLAQAAVGAVAVGRGGADG
jgi:hypothetical protein